MGSLGIRKYLGPYHGQMNHASDVEAAVPKALRTGSFFFMDIEQNRVYESALAIVRFIAAQGEGAVIKQNTLERQFPNDLDYALQLVLRRDLIEQIEGGYRFQVEMIRRWFAPGD